MASLEDLGNYVRSHVERGGCLCGRCGPGDRQQPTGHTADLVFFKVRAVNEPDAAVLRKLVQACVHGEVDLFDHHVHGYIELGAWMGSQQIALLLMGLGALLGLWKLLTPYTVIPDVDTGLAMSMAGHGFLTVQA